MFLYIDFRNGSQAIALVTEDDKISWVRGESRRGEFELLAEAAEAFAFLETQPRCVVAAVWPDGAPDVSWSTARTSVAVANTLAFAWGVSAVGLDVSELSDEGLPKAVREASASAEAGARIDVSYSGDPNISQPKKIF